MHHIKTWKKKEGKEGDLVSIKKKQRRSKLKIDWKTIAVAIALAAVATATNTAEDTDADSSDAAGRCTSEKTNKPVGSFSQQNCSSYKMY